MKKSLIYKIHRYLSIACLIPVLLWCVSGLTHPIMANWFRIKPAHRTAPITQVDTAKVNFTLKEVVSKNQIHSFQNIGIKSFNNQLFYLIEKEESIDLYSSSTGEKIERGDVKYANFLARYYLGNDVADISNTTVIKSFTEDYKVINRHLPVYKVSFNDKAKSDVFVHIQSGGLGTINDSFKRTQLWIFSNFHNWSFLGDNHTIKPFFVFTFSLSAFVVGVLGLYIYGINRKKYKKRKATKNQKLKRRNLHRYISIPVSVFYLMFSFSGAYHAFQKFELYFLNQYQPQKVYELKDVSQDFLQLPNVDKLQRVSLVTIKGDNYYRVSYVKNPIAQYYTTKDLSLKQQGDEVYAKERAVEIVGLESSAIKEVKLITRFEKSYGFINKRLPVYQVAFKDSEKTSCFVETASGIPGSVVNTSKKREALSFVMLHKFHFLDSIGKGNRDIIIAIAVLSVMLVLFTGLKVFIQIIRKK